MPNFNSIDELDSLNISFKKTTTDRYDIYKCQNIMTFDIETANGFVGEDGIVKGFSHKKLKKNPHYYDDKKKVSNMYVWQYGYDNDTDIKAFGNRYWAQFEQFMEELSKRITFQVLCPGEKYDDAAYEVAVKYFKNTKIKAMCFIHNAGFEFQHLRNIWEKEFAKASRYKSAVFARSERSPMKFCVKIGKVNWEFRDSYVLTGMSLKAWTKDLPVAKLSEPSWFYLPVLTPETPLSQERIAYSINDVVSMVYGLRKYKDDYEDLFNIPLTQTGIVRRAAVANVAHVNKEWSEHCAEVTTSTSWEEYCDLMDLFAGGWTHANSLYTDQLLKDITCFDFASSYPACMTTRTFPYTKFEECSPDEYDWLLNLNLKDNELPYHYWLEFEAEDVHSVSLNTWWSSSKCVNIEGGVFDNGKIYHANKVTIKMTDLDFDTFRKAYTYKNPVIKRMYKSEARHLPIEMIMLILGWYSKKTSYKNVEGKEDEYNSSKRSINGIYGCFVTKDVTDVVSFAFGEDGSGWYKHNLTEEEYNEMISEKTESQWTMYQCGVWVTAWARHNLWDAILQLDERTVYCDTDSIKGLYTEEDKKWIEDYNKEILALHEYMSSKYDIDIDLYRPTDPDGIVRPLGIFAPDGNYKEFKTLGAKRYCSLEYNKKKNRDEIHTTIAGLPKSAGAKKIEELGGVKAFDSGIVWNSEESNKLTSYYNDNQPELIWQDMNGELYTSTDKYGLCLMPTSFDMSMTDDYEAFCSLIQHGNTDENFFEPLTKLYVEHLKKSC